VPQAPLRALQAPDRRAGQARVGGVPAEAARCLQRVLEAHCSVPPIQHNRGIWQHLALQAPKASIAVAQHRRGRVRTHAGCGERLPECLGRDGRARAREREAVLGAIGMDHLARNHLEAAPLCPVPAAHIAAIEPDHDRTAGRRCC